MDITSYILAKRYTDENIVETRQYVEETVLGTGAIKGAPCEIRSIEKVEGGHNITFSWKLFDESEQVATIFVKDGVDGLPGKEGTGITRIEQTLISTEDGKRESVLTIYLSDGKEYSFKISGERGADGATPEIGSNGNWFINGVDTGVIAAPDLANYYSEANLLPLSIEEIDKICEAI